MLIKKRYLARLALGLLGAATFAGVAHAQDSGEATTEAQQAPELLSKIWWNQPAKIEELALTQEQRAQMDSLMTGYLEGRRGGAKRQREAMDALGTALARGDDQAARSAGEEMADRMSSAVREQTVMMADVVSLLTPEQRESLVSRYPRMLSSFWVRVANPQSLRGGQARKRGQP